MKLLTSEKIIKESENIIEFVPFKYRLTDGEIGWVNFVRGRYCIADWIYYNTDDEFLLTINKESIQTMSETLDLDDMAPKAVCLDDTTALQHIFFYLYNEGQ